MLKITTVHEDEKAATLIVDGTITDNCLADIEALCCQYIVEKKKKVLLDLKGVTFVDRKGVTLLKNLQGYGVEIVSSTLYINSLLNLTEEEFSDDHKC